MSAVSRIDQAVLLLSERLRRLNEKSALRSSASSQAKIAGRNDPLTPLRELAQSGRIEPGEMRKALVRALLAGSLGQDAAGSLEFQSISDQVLSILEDSEAGRALLERVLQELDQT